MNSKSQPASDETATPVCEGHPRSGETIVAAPAIPLRETGRGTYFGIARIQSPVVAPVYLKKQPAVVLEYCRSFATFDEHVESLVSDCLRHENAATAHALAELPWFARFVARAHGGRNNEPLDDLRPRLKGILTSLIERGLFVYHDEIVTKLREVRTGERKITGIGAIGIRSVSGSNAARSVFSDLRRSSGSSPAPFVIGLGNTRFEDACSNEARPGLWHATAETRDRLALFLTQHGIDERTVAIALGRDSSVCAGTGVDRNMLLLLTAGHGIASFDPEVTIDPVLGVGVPSRMLRISSSEDPRELIVDSDPDRLAQYSSPTSGSILMAMAGTLGRRLSSLVDDADGTQIDARVSPSALDSLIRHPGTLEIAAIIPGVMGRFRPDWNSNLSRMRLCGTNSDAPKFALWGSRDNSQRVCLRYTNSLTASLGDYFDGTCFAYDNSVLGPPFEPCFGGQDKLFGAMLRLSKPEACVAYRPEIVRCGAARVIDDPPSRVVRMRVSDLFRRMVVSMQPSWPLGSVEDWCAYMSAGLKASSLAKPSSLFELVYQCAYSEWTSLYEIAHNLLDADRPLPGKLSRDLLQFCESVNAALQHPENALPVDCGRSADQADCIVALQACLGEFADLLAAWPAMWRACASMPMSERQQAWR